MPDTEKFFVEDFSTTNYHPVVSEQQASHGRDGADKINKTFVQVFHITALMITTAKVGGIPCWKNRRYSSDDGLFSDERLDASKDLRIFAQL